MIRSYERVHRMILCISQYKAPLKCHQGAFLTYRYLLAGLISVWIYRNGKFSMCLFFLNFRYHYYCFCLRCPDHYVFHDCRHRLLFLCRHCDQPEQESVAI